LKLYEAMFVVDSNKSRQDHDKVVEELTAVIQKGGGELVNCEKWEERKLAYPLMHHKRGTYYLSHFKSDGETIGRIERAAQLNETVLRVMVTVDVDGESMPVYADAPDDFPSRGGRRSGPPRDRRDGPRPRPATPRPEAPKQAPTSTPAETSNEATPEQSKDAAD
jgi:ribosomal protein S6